MLKCGEGGRVRNEFRGKAGGQDVEHLTRCGGDFAIHSEMRSHWRIVNRGVSPTNLCFKKISLAAIWKLVQDSKHERRGPIR